MCYNEHRLIHTCCKTDEEIMTQRKEKEMKGTILSTFIKPYNSLGGLERPKSHG